MENLIKNPRVRPIIIAAISALTTIIALSLLYSSLSEVVESVNHKLPLLEFDTRAAAAPGCIVIMLFIALVAYGDYRYHFAKYATKKQRENDFNKLQRFAGKGAIVGLILAFGASFFVFNPLVERFYLTANDYTRCPNQLQLSSSMFTSIWVKQEAWCFDKGFQKSLGFHSQITPLDYLKQLEGQPLADGKE